MLDCFGMSHKNNTACRSIVETSLHLATLSTSRALVQGDSQKDDDLANVYDHLDAWQLQA